MSSTGMDTFRLLEEYYQYWIEEGFISVLKYDDDIFILEEKESKNRIVITRENLITPDIPITKGYEWYGLEECFKNYNYELDNNKMKFSRDKGFYANNYAEYFFEYLKLNEEFQGRLSETQVLNFKIDDVEFEIGCTSETFKLIFNHISMDKHFEWDHYYTIKLRNVKKEMLEDYLQNALYYLYKHSPSEYSNDYPHIYQYSYYYGGWNEIEGVDESEFIKNFSLGKYTEALAFYNDGKLNRNFLSFYKVLEYFFLINRKDEFKSLILDYNENDDMDKVLKEITRVYKTKEEDLLEVLLNNINNLEPIMDTAFSKGLISSKDNKKEFAKKLYGYRNSRVHGKKDTNLNLLVPSMLDFNSNDEWELVIEDVADLVIKQFCYS
ncbi:hypothetical protein [Bacillus cereus]|uniref:hypothetical protein n=1 Tax=Bacillus cereus TaxID=1396 RepID=UPI000BFC7542|nr:hypothetical protein [Bacillus cereus]PGT07238.1 hypothetical protein COD03_27285 [Bacillus cereus]